MTLLYPTYFAPIIQYAALLQSSKYTFEIEDNFQKQSYRTRCYIYGSNGKQLLSVPVKHHPKGLKKKTKEVKIDNETTPWKKIHLKSIQAAYRSSPFFEFYENDLEALFQKKHDYLLDLNLDIHDFIMAALQENCNYSKTKTYEITSSANDLRILANAKIKPQTTFSKYIQMFDGKHGFIENLSILDLLFMEGPQASEYLKKLELSI